MRSARLSLHRGAQLVLPTRTISPGLIFSRAKARAGKYCRRCSKRLEDDWRTTMASLRLAKFC